MTMKKIYKKIGLLLSLVTLFTACDLDREPYDGIESEKLFSTVEGAQTALKGVYTSFQNYGYYHNSGGLFICPDILSDNPCMKCATIKPRMAIISIKEATFL